MDCDFCDKEFPSNFKLKRHLANIHDIGVVWHKCDHCDYSCKDPYNLKKHKANIHDIDVKYWICDVEGCTWKFKSSSDLKRHQSAQHDINVKWFKCNLCDEKFKTSPNLKRHKQTVHHINTVWYKCPKCNYKAKTKSDLKGHKSRKHGIDVTWHYCNLCNKKFHVNSDLYAHKQGAHNINVKWHPCPAKDCTYKAKRNYLLKDHMSYRHDIGDKQCDYCLENRYKLTAYKDKKSTAHICRTCLRRVTGRDSRVEIEMSKYLDKHFGIEYLLASDSRLYGNACHKYRPDKLYASPGFVLHIECDEQQHQYSGNDYSCDEKRISDIYDEFPGHKYVIIRWNPDKYTPPAGKQRIKTRSEKLELLLECVGSVVQYPPKEQIKIIYMFYDQDNTLISQNIPHTLIYDWDDAQYL